MSQQKQNQTGRTLFDLIADPPKYILPTAIILFIVSVILIIILGPLKVGSWEIAIGKQSKNWVPCDTLKIRDTIYINKYIQTDAKSKKPPPPTKQIQVQSYDQKGGQTAGEITNY